jgi:MoaA/NifB/PqqE/SkfB family radical SAM enzyme
MCLTHADAPASQKFEDLPEALFEKIERLSPHLSTATIAVGGEPLLGRDFVSKIERLHQQKPELHIRIISNGLPLANEKFAQSVLPHLSEMHISLNGTSAYGSIMKGGTFEQFLKAMENVREFRGVHNKPDKVFFDFILMKRNKDDILPAARLMEEMGFDGIYYKNLVIAFPEFLEDSIFHDRELYEELYAKVRSAASAGYSISCEPWPELNQWSLRSKSPLSWLRRLRKWSRLLSRSPREFAKRLRARLRDLGRVSSARLLRKRAERPACEYPWTQMLIETNGEVRFCCEGATIIGNLSSGEPADFWWGEEARKYRDGMLSETYYKACAGCRRVTPRDADSYRV